MSRGFCWDCVDWYEVTGWRGFMPVETKTMIKEYKLTCGHWTGKLEEDQCIDSKD